MGPVLLFQLFSTILNNFKYSSDPTSLKLCPFLQNGCVAEPYGSLSIISVFLHVLRESLRRKYHFLYEAD